jgi:hypothetical protein
MNLNTTIDDQNGSCHFCKGMTRLSFPCKFIQNNRTVLLGKIKRGLNMLQTKTNKKTHKENVIVSDWQAILYKDIQEIHLIINYIMLSIKWSQ